MEIKRRSLPARVLAPLTLLRAGLSSYGDDRYPRGVMEAVAAKMAAWARGE
ncbi:MAG: hypothetical protein SVX38_11780 [Chloroflexota bacterium]|nr:hypothetical protein [Chloroflexota bacterium]